MAPSIFAVVSAVITDTATAAPAVPPTLASATSEATSLLLAVSETPPVAETLVAAPLMASVAPLPKVVLTTAASTFASLLALGFVLASMVTSDLASTARAPAVAVTCDPPWISTAGSALPAITTSFNALFDAFAFSVSCTNDVSETLAPLSTEPESMSILAPEKLVINEKSIPRFVPVLSTLTVESDSRVRLPLALRWAPVNAISEFAFANSPWLMTGSLAAREFEFRVRSPVTATVPLESISELLCTVRL